MFGFSEDYLQQNWVAFGSDGTSVMIGRRLGVATMIIEKFPRVITWRYAAHRLKLAVYDTAEEVAGINHFRSFMDKLSSLYSMSPKNQR